MTGHPRETQRLVGHTATFDEAARAWDADRFPHARLVTGPRGIGKATFVYQLARRILGTNETGRNDPNADRLITGGEHPDLYVLEPPEGGQGTQPVIRVDAVRRASRFCALGCARAAWRIVVVDPADALNASAANALLKDLEEPPERVVFLLISHMPARLVATIRSRCAPIRLGPLPWQQTVEVIASQRPDITDGESLAVLAGGAPGRAIALAEAGAADLYREIVATLATIPEHDPATWPVFADRIAADAPTFRIAGDLLRHLLSHVLHILATGETPGEAVAGEAAALTSLSHRGDLERWLGVWDKVTHLVDRAERANLDRRHVMLTALLEIEAAAIGRHMATTMTEMGSIE